jgi:hypothetical protein
MSKQAPANMAAASMPLLPLARPSKGLTVPQSSGLFPQAAEKRGDFGMFV